MKKAKLQNAALLALLAVGFLLLDLVLDRYFNDPGQIRWSHLFLVVSVLLTSYMMLSRAMHSRARAEAVLRQARDEMESRVRRRTAELEQVNEALRTEVAERKRMEEALRASEEKFATVFHQFPHPLVISRIADSSILDINEAAERPAGVSRSEIIGKTWSELRFIPTAEEQSKLAELFRATGQVADYELDFTANDGEVASLLVSLIPIAVSGEPCALAILHDITERKRSEAALRQAQAELVLGIQQRSALEERQRLARELHDSVSQALYGISLGVNTALTLFDTDRAKVLEALNYTIGLARAALAEMRALIFELRPESLESEGLAAALTKQLEALRARHGIEVRLSVSGEPDVPLAVKEAAYGIAREAMQNTVKHARADRLEVCLACDQDGLWLEVSDNGVGFDAQAGYPGHLGLRSMRERAGLVGGTLEVTSVPGSGTHIRVCLPIPVQQEETVQQRPGAPLHAFQP